MYFKIRITTGEILEGPIPLPQRVAGLASHHLQDLSSTGPDCPTDLVGIGYWPEEWEYPTNYDASQQKMSDEVQVSVMMTRRVVNLRPRLVNLTQDEKDAIILQQAKDALSSLDAALPRAVEDVISATGLDVTTLPKAMQDRLAAKVAARETVRRLTTGQ